MIFLLFDLGLIRFMVLGARDLALDVLGNLPVELFGERPKIDARLGGLLWLGWLSARLAILRRRSPRACSRAWLASFVLAAHRSLSFHRTLA